MEDFWNFIADNDLIDIFPKNEQFTLTNHRKNFTNISEKLDRFLVGSYWWGDNQTLSSPILLVSVSNHYLVQLEVDFGGKLHKGHFKFQSMWWQDTSFASKVKEWWEKSRIFQGTPSFYFVKCLKFLKRKNQSMEH